MSSEERRATIVKAALPLFARNGFASTTTRELAQAAKVSEALIYKHFPSKESLYSEIQAYVYQGRDQILQKLSSLAPSTETLVHVLYYVVKTNLVCCETDSVNMETRQRMLLNSCLEDGSFARFMFHNRVCGYMSQITESIEAAIRAGDLLGCPGRRQNAIYFAYHLSAMVSTMHLPESPVVDYGASRQDLLNEVVLFSLRGIGLTESAIGRYYDPGRLAAFFTGETLINRI